MNYFTAMREHFKRAARNLERAVLANEDKDRLFVENYTKAMTGVVAGMFIKPLEREVEVITTTDTTEGSFSGAIGSMFMFALSIGWLYVMYKIFMFVVFVVVF